MDIDLIKLGNYELALIVAGVVLEQSGKYLLVQEKKPSAYGLWNLPAGRVDKGHTIEQTAIKEAKEETGFDVQLGKELLVAHEDVNSAVKHSFSAKIISGELRFPEDEILDARWFSLSEVEAMKDKLRSEWVINSIIISKK